MALLPPGLYDIIGLVAIIVGIVVVFRRDVPKAYGFGVIMLGIYGLDVIAGLLGGTTIRVHLAYQVEGFLAGAWWTPLTSIFVHADLWHLFGNLFILVTAGPSLEDRIGDRRFLAIFFVAGFMAIVAHTLLAFIVPNMVSPFSLAVGASGAIFGVLTAFAVRYPRAPLPILLLFFLVYMPAFVVLLIYLGFNLVYLLGSVQGLRFGIAWWGHFAGFFVGLAWAYRLPRVNPDMIPTTGTRGLPDPDKLNDLATTPQLRSLLDKARQFDPDARTSHDATFALAWVDRFLEKAVCPTCGKTFTRKGLEARCASGETTVDLRHEQ